MARPQTFRTPSYRVCPRLRQWLAQGLALGLIALVPVAANGAGLGSGPDTPPAQPKPRVVAPRPSAPRVATPPVVVRPAPRVVTPVRPTPKPTFNRPTVKTPPKPVVKKPTTVVKKPTTVKKNWGWFSHVSPFSTISIVTHLVAVLAGVSLRELGTAELRKRGVRHTRRIKIR